MEFLGYERPGGQVGVRNHVTVIPAGRCSNDLAGRIAEAVQGVVPLRHNHACVLTKPDNERSLRTLIAMGSNPNIAAVLVVGIGCESLPAKDIGQGIAESGKEVEVVTIEDAGGFQQAVDSGTLVLREFVTRASTLKRKPFGLEHLTIGVKCGGSATLSGVAGNAAVGWLIDRVMEQGGKAVFTEPTEIIGAEHILAERAVNREVKRRFLEMIDRNERRIKATGVDIRGTQPTPANIENGLSTIEEKSLGAIRKIGSAPLSGVLEYGEIPDSPGLYFMDCSAWTSHLMVGFAAAGAQLSIFSLGGGLAASFRGIPGSNWVPVVPTLKVLSDPQMKKENEYIDIYAGSIIEGGESVAQVGQRLLSEIIEIASGKLARLEINPGYQELLELYTDGPWI